jgi:serine/threonine protein kinase
MQKYTEININGNQYEVKDLYGIFGSKGKGEGEGEVGTVYFGRKVGNKEDNLAFKFLKDTQNMDTETGFFKILLDKIKKIKGCTKYIVDLIDFGISSVKGKREYIVVMEKPKDFITIKQYVNDQKNYPSNNIVKKIYTELLKGIYCIHSSGFAHCDIKSENVMIHPTSYEIKYIDFGSLVKIDSSCTIIKSTNKFYNGGSDLGDIGQLVSSIINPTTYELFIDSLKDPIPKLEVFQKTDEKKKVIALQKFYRSVCEDEYIKIGELKRDDETNDIYFVNKNGYKTFVEGNVSGKKLTLSDTTIELYYDS